MTEEQIRTYRQAAKDGSLPEEDNPLFLFSKVSTSLLAKALAKEFNIYTLIKMEMSVRGVDEKGRWVGFDAAKQKQKASRPITKDTQHNKS